MSLLRTVRCVHCGEKIEVPMVGGFRIQCGKCSKVNLFRSPMVAKPPVQESVVVPENVPVLSVAAEPLKAAPKATPKGNPKAAPEAAPEATPEAFPAWSPKMRKEEVLAIAKGLGLEVSAKNSKGDILEALRKAQAKQEAS